MPKSSNTNPPVPEAGSAAPDFEACSVDGRVVRLSEYWRDSPVVTVFLRHLGCPFCRQQVLALRDNYAAFQNAGAQVACVTMGSEKAGRAFQIMFDLPYPLLMLGESNTRPYVAYGLTRGSFFQLLGPRVISRGFAALRELGSRTGTLSAPGDKMQMPGTFIIDRAGQIRLAYRSQDAADNASIPLLLQALEQMRGANAQTSH